MDDCQGLLSILLAVHRLGEQSVGSAIFVETDAQPIAVSADDQRQRLGVVLDLLLLALDRRLLARDVVLVDLDLMLLNEECLLMAIKSFGLALIDERTGRCAEREDREADRHQPEATPDLLWTHTEADQTGLKPIIDAPNVSAAGWTGGTSE